MKLSLLERQTDLTWRIEPHGAMRVPGIIYANEALIRGMDRKVYEQVCNVATLPGIVTASYAMPDAHWGYGFPIGGVAAFDPEAGGIISAGGVGFDISCGVRSLTSGLTLGDIQRADRAGRRPVSAISAAGATGVIRLAPAEMDAMLAGGAQWAVARGYGIAADLERIEERGCMQGAEPAAVSAHAKIRQRDEIGTLGSGNHYLEIQHVAEVYDATLAQAFGLAAGDILVTIHCGSRGLGHQIGTEFLRYGIAAHDHGIRLPIASRLCAPRFTAPSLTWAPCARLSIARSRTESSLTWYANRSLVCCRKRGSPSTTSRTTPAKSKNTA
jgi:tRNA-splicing ligase RtcB